jgi:hypothetical protein
MGIFLAFVLSLLAATVFAGKPPTITCDPGYAAECVAYTPVPVPTATRTPTGAPTPTRTATAMPTSVPTAAPTTAPTAAPSGPDYTLSPDALDFGPVSVGTNSSPQTIRIDTVTGGYKVAIEVDPPFVRTDQNCEAQGTWDGTLNPNSHCPFGVALSPIAAGKFDGFARVTSGETTHRVSLSGSGTTASPTTIPPPLPTTVPTTAPTALPTVAPTVAPPTPTVPAAPTPTVAPVPTTGPPSNAAQTPIPPQRFMDTSLPTVSGTDRVVTAGQNLQAVLDTAVPGDAVTIQAGATFNGKFWLRKKPQSWTTTLLRAVGLASTKVVWIRSSAWQSLPAPGTRVTKGDASKMPKLQNSGEATVIADIGASNYRFTGIEITTGWTNGVADNSWGLVTLGIDPVSGGSITTLDGLPDNVILDRVWIHGTKAGSNRRGVTANTRSFAIVDSIVDEIHSYGKDSQAVGGWNADGPTKIVNNDLSAAGEVIMWGGADAKIANLTPTDFEIRNNYFHWPSEWHAPVPSVGDPGSSNYDGSQWSLKNLFEMKHGKQMIISGNVFDGWWASGQVCPLMITVRNSDGTNPWATVQDLKFENNVVRNIGPGTCMFNMFGQDSPPPSGGGNSQQTVRVQFVDNYIDMRGTPALTYAFRILGGTDSTWIEHNTIEMNKDSALLGLDQGHGPNTNMVYRNNIVAMGRYGVACSGLGMGNPALGTCAPGIDFRGNLVYGPYPTSGGSTPSAISNYPGNYFPADYTAVGVDPATHLLGASSAWKGKATDGGNPGILTAK